MAFIKVPNTLPAFIRFINERNIKPSIYIVRLSYKYVYEDIITESNEILQFDPAYRTGVKGNDTPWYTDFWEWYTDWYMCVESNSVKVLDFVELDDVFNFRETMRGESDGDKET